MPKPIEYSVQFDTARALQQARRLRSQMVREFAQIELLPRGARLDAASAASNIGRGMRFAVERELRQLDLIPDRAISEARSDIAQLQGDIRRLNQGGATGGRTAGGYALGNGIGALRSAAATLGIGLGVREIAQGAAELEQLDTRALLAEKSLALAAGSAGKAQAAIEGVKAASGGAISGLGAAEFAAASFNLKLAETPEQVERLAKAVNSIIAVSPVVNTAERAFQELALTVNNASDLRLDQLGLSAQDLGGSLKSLGSNGERLEAVLSALERKFGDLSQVVIDNQSSTVRMGAAWSDFRVTLASELAPAIDTINQKLIEMVNNANFSIGGGGIDEVLDRIQQIQEGSPSGTFDIFGIENLSVGEISKDLLGLLTAGFAGSLDLSTEFGQLDFDVSALTKAGDALERLNEEMKLGTPGAEELRDRVEGMARALIKGADLTEGQAQALEYITVELGKASSGVDLYAKSADDAAGSSEGLTDATNRNSEEFLKNERAVFAAGLGFDSLGVSALSALENIHSLTGGVITLNTHLAELGASNAAALSGAENAIEGRLLSQAQQLVRAGGDPAEAYELFLKQNEAAQQRIGFLRNAQPSGAPVNEASLKIQETAILEQYAQPIQDLIDAGKDQQRAERDAAKEQEKRESRVSREQEAIRRSVLSEVASVAKIVGDDRARELGEVALAALPGQFAGVDPSAISDLDLTLVSEEARAELLAGFEAIHEAERQQLAAEKEATRANTRLQKDAAKDLKEAARELESSLRDVPGLLGTSDVTQKQLDLAKLGVDQDFADNYLRRLTDEVTNGVDWDNVDIGDAAKRAGIDPNLPADVILEQFRAAWADSSLFANESNLDLINTDAVNAALERQRLSLEGQQNVLELFGAGQQELIDEFVGGGSVVGGGRVSLPDARPATLDIDLDQYIADMQEATRQATLASTVVTPELGEGLDQQATIAVTPEVDLSGFLGDADAQTEEARLLGELMSETVAKGFTAHDRSSYDFAQAIIGDVGTSIGENLEPLQSQGHAMSAVMAAAFVTHDRSEYQLAQGFISDIGINIGQNVEAIQNQGRALSANVALGFTNADRSETDFAMPFLTDVAESFRLEANQATLQGIGTNTRGLIDFWYQNAAGRGNYAEPIVANIMADFARDAIKAHFYGIGEGIVDLIVSGYDDAAEDANFGSLGNNVAAQVLGEVADALEGQ